MMSIIIWEYGGLYRIIRVNMYTQMKITRAVDLQSYNRRTVHNSLRRIRISFNTSYNLHGICGYQSHSAWLLRCHSFFRIRE